MLSCWAAPCCAGRAAAQLPGEQLSRRGPHTRCTAEGGAPCWAATAGRTAACCPPPAAGEYQGRPALQHLHGGKHTGEERATGHQLITSHLSETQNRRFRESRYADNITFHFKQILKWDDPSQIPLIWHSAASVTETGASVSDGQLWEAECGLCQLISLRSDVRKTPPRMRYGSIRLDEFTLRLLGTSE